MNLQPKTIDPGWAKRWTRQSIELFRRAPGVAVGIMTLFDLVNVLVPQPIALNVPLTVFMVGILFSSLRAADHDSGHALHATLAFFRQTARDLAHLARDAFLFLLVFWILSWLPFAFHGDGAITSNSAYFQLPGWLCHGVRREGAMLALGVFVPGVIPLIFLTMCVGNQPLIHYATGFGAAELNLRLSMVFTIGLFACGFVMSILRQTPSWWLACTFLAGFAAAFWWFGAWGYLWCREMFEGTKENARETAKQSSRVHASA